MAEAGDLPGVEEKLPWEGWGALAASIVMMVAGVVMFVYQADWGGSREAWIVLSAVLGLGGVGLLTWFFEKWGKL